MRSSCVLALLVALGLPGPAAAAVPGVSIPVAGIDIAGAVARGDVTGDGRPDVVVRDGSTIVVLPAGNPAASFRATAPLRDVYGFAVGDVTGDGHADVVVTGFPASGSDRVTAVLPGQDGGFGAAVISPVFQVAPIAVADADGDGRADVWSAGSLARSIGDGRLAAPIPVGDRGVAQGSSLAVGDVTRDGIPDEVVADDRGLQVLVGRGGLTWATAAPKRIAGDETPQIADLDGDGRLDLVTGEDVLRTVAVGADGTIGSLGPGSGVLERAAAMPVDVDHDGVTDLVAVPTDDADLSAPRVVAVARGLGAGRFATPSVLGDVPPSAAGVTSADLTGDGVDDVVIAAGKEVRVVPGGTVIPAPQATVLPDADDLLLAALPGGQIATRPLLALRTLRVHDGATVTTIGLPARSSLPAVVPGPAAIVACCGAAPRRVLSVTPRRTAAVHGAAAPGCRITGVAGAPSGVVVVVRAGHACRPASRGAFLLRRGRASRVVGPTLPLRVPREASARLTPYQALTDGRTTLVAAADHGMGGLQAIVAVTPSRRRHVIAEADDANDGYHELRLVALDGGRAYWTDEGGDQRHWLYRRRVGGGPVSGRALPVCATVQVADGRVLIQRAFGVTAAAFSELPSRGGARCDR